MTLVFDDYMLENYNSAHLPYVNTKIPRGVYQVCPRIWKNNWLKVLLAKRARNGHDEIKYTVRLRIILVTKCGTSVYQFHQTYQVSVYKCAKWVRTNVFEIKMHIVRQLSHIDKNEVHAS